MYLATVHTVSLAVLSTEFRPNGRNLTICYLLDLHIKF